MERGTMALVETTPGESLLNVAGPSELVLTVESKTHRQVENLQIDCTDERVVVTGLCKSYYVKQLVTHAILAVCPFAKLENQVRVCVA
jgi:hypothetical protein